MEYRRPTTVRKIKQFLGLTDYYQRVIKGYPNIALLLLQILEGKKPFSLKKEQ
jgi:hypothetical protein